jgi:ribosomal protein L37AE/L43A
MKAALSAMPNFFYCLNPSCDSGHIHDEATDTPIFRCEKCGFKSCVVHNRGWHEGVTCREYDRQSLTALNERASIAEVNRIAKKCPNCRRLIQKRGGCDHMTCSVCSHEFCWVCFADYTKILENSKYRHKQTCKYHPKDIR